MVRRSDNFLNMEFAQASALAEAHCCRHDLTVSARFVANGFDFSICNAPASIAGLRIDLRSRPA